VIAEAGGKRERLIIYGALAPVCLMAGRPNRTREPGDGEAIKLKR
jgi:hypothetical protein